MTLQDALDHLKLNIDAMHLALVMSPPCWPTCVIGWNPGFPPWASAWSGMWTCCPIAPDSSAMRELQFMLFEALSNVLQHAHARIVAH